MKKILVLFEKSGVVRRAFRDRGLEAWSCDLQEAEDGSDFHWKGDIRELPGLWRVKWDLVIAHPPCTCLCVSGNRWYAGTQERKDAIEFVQSLYKLNAERVAIENPVGVLSSAIGKPNQIIQPYDFGEDASKATCLWLYNLPLLKPTKRVPGRIVNGKERWANQTDSGQNRLGPSPDRADKRSRTYKGIANAMADQWGACLR